MFLKNKKIEVRLVPEGVSLKENEILVPDQTKVENAALIKMLITHTAALSVGVIATYWSFRILTHIVVTKVGPPIVIGAPNS